MPTPFSSLLNSIRRNPEELTLEVPEDWMQGRSVFGGLQLAFALEAMRSLVPDIPLRTLQTTLIAPTSVELTARVRILRQGKNATHVEARLVDREHTAAIAIGVFGTARPSRVGFTPSRPDIEATANAELPFVPGVSPNFVQHFRARLLRGALPFSGTPTKQCVFELAMHDEARTTDRHLVAIADFVPPVALSWMPQPTPGSTLSWMLELLIDDPSSLPLHSYRVDAELLAARDGYTSQSVVVWGASGRPLVLSRQSMLVFG